MVIWSSHGTVDDRQTREKFQCLYKNLNSNNFRKTAVLKKKFYFFSFDWDFKENVNRKQTFIRKFIFQFSVELGQLGLLDDSNKLLWSIVKFSTHAYGFFLSFT